MACPNHDADQICPDCAYGGKYASRGRGSTPTPPPARKLSPIEQHKGDLEMIIAACEAASSPDLGAIRPESIRDLTAALLKRIPEHKIVRGKTTICAPCALCCDATNSECRWTHRGEDADASAREHTRATGHMTSVETLTRTEYSR